MDIDTALLQTIGALNQAAINPDGWDEALQSFSNLVGVEAVSIERFDLAEGSANALGYVGFPDAGMAEYFEHVHQFNPRIRYAESLPIGAIVSDDIMAPPLERAGNEFFNWLETNAEFTYCIGLKLEHDARYQSVLAIHRPNQALPFTSEGVKLFAAMAPTMVTIHQTACDLARLRELGLARIAAMNSMRSGLGLLDRHGRLCEANRALRARLSQLDLISRTQFGRVCAVASMARSKFEAALNNALAGNIQSVRLVDQANRNVVVRFVPLPRGNRLRVLSDACILMIVRGASIDEVAPAELTELFDLAPREAELAVGLLNRLSLQEVADHMGILISTARVHLRNIFTKTGTSRQSDLVALLMDSTARP